MSARLTPAAPGAGARASAPRRFLGATLTAGALASTALFGLYILAFYGRALVVGAPRRWNEVLPGLYDERLPAATAALGLHFLAGAILLLLGFLQLVPAIRRRRPQVHRRIGRTYVCAAIVAGLGGLAFVAAEGTIGGAVMDAGFGLYGLLMIAFAVQAWRHARARRFEQHRAWALRLFVLALGSWLYRMEYGLWLTLFDGAGHDDAFRGPFDRAMAFTFYVPNLIVLEALLRRRDRAPSWPRRAAGGAALAAAAALVLVGTYYFTKSYWGPAIVKGFLGSPS